MEVLQQIKYSRKNPDRSNYPLCPKCSLNIHVIKDGIVGERQNYKCRTCKKRFVFNPFHLRKPYVSTKRVKIPKIPKIVDKSVYPECPLCHSKDLVVKSGKTSNGTQVYLCNLCQKKFQENSKITPEIIRISQTVDSLTDIPCFFCIENSRGCNPIECFKLEKWSVNLWKP